MSQKLLKRFQDQIASAQTNLDKFAADFAKDPVHALSWSNDTFRDAARIKVLRQITEALAAGTATLDNIRATLTDRVMHRAKYPPQSTSPVSNLMEQFELAAYASILSDLEYFVE